MGAYLSMVSGSPITGEIRAGLFNQLNIPFGWLVCDGSEIDASKYPRLAALITAADDGKKYLPYLQDGVLRGAGVSTKGTLSGSNTPIVPVPKHSHKLAYTQMGSGTQSGQVSDSAEGDFIIGSEMWGNSSNFMFSIGLSKNLFADSLPDRNVGLSLSPTGEENASLDVRGKSLYVNFIIYAL